MRILSCGTKIVRIRRNLQQFIVVTFSTSLYVQLIISRGVKWKFYRVTEREPQTFFSIFPDNYDELLAQGVSCESAAFRYMKRPQRRTTYSFPGSHCIHYQQFFIRECRPSIHSFQHSYQSSYFCLVCSIQYSALLHKTHKYYTECCASDVCMVLQE